MVKTTRPRALIFGYVASPSGSLPNLIESWGGGGGGGVTFIIGLNRYNIKNILA